MSEQKPLGCFCGSWKFGEQEKKGKQEITGKTINLSPVKRSEQQNPAQGIICPLK